MSEEKLATAAVLVRALEKHFYTYSGYPYHVAGRLVSFVEPNFLVLNVHCSEVGSHPEKITPLAEKVTNDIPESLLADIRNSGFEFAVRSI